jgi:hypothetical protein
MEVEKEGGAAAAGLRRFVVVRMCGAEYTHGSLSSISDVTRDGLSGAW